MKKQGFAKIRAAMKGKGFIVALALSIAAVGFSTYYAYNSVMNGFGGEDSDELFIEVDKNQPGIPMGTTTAKPTPPPQTEATTAATNPPADSSTEPQTEPANNFFAASSPRVWPADGEIINGYSGGELVKSETLNLWQTHDGVDIAAEIGAEIRACGEGKVLNIWEDALWGVCVSIDHGDGNISSVYGLAADVSVSMGQEIAGGDVIGKAGNTAECECKLAPHVHFEVKKTEALLIPLVL